MLGLEEHPDDIVSFPVQAGLTLPIRQAAARAGRAEHMALWAGQAAALARPMGAGDLLSVLVGETTRALERVGQLGAQDAVAAETRAIADVIQLYFDGLYEGDTLKLARAFDASARLYSLNEGEVRELSRDEWLTILAGRPAPKASGLARTDRIVSIAVTGEDLATVRSLAQEVAAIVRKNEHLTNVHLDANEPSKIIKLDIDQDRARVLGVSSQDLANFLQSSLSGARVSLFREGDELIEMLLRGPGEERARLSREIHDTVAQGLVGVIRQLETVGGSSRPTPARR